MLRWSQNVPIIQIDVSQAVLAARPKNTPTECAAAEKKVHTMHDMRTDACSGLYIDRDGVPLLAVFADEIVDSPHNGKVCISCGSDVTSLTLFSRKSHIVQLNLHPGAERTRTLHSPRVVEHITDTA